MFFTAPQTHVRCDYTKILPNLILDPLVKSGEAEGATQEYLGRCFPDALVKKYTTKKQKGKR